MLKDRIKDSESGIGAPFVLNGELGPPRFRRMADVYVLQEMFSPPLLMCIFHGLSAVLPFGLPDWRPGL